MKIAFINPYDYIVEQTKKSECQVPLGILSLSQVINSSEKHSSEVISMPHAYFLDKFQVKKSFNDNIENDAKYIIATNPDIISIYTMCNTYHVALSLAKRIKSINPKIFILLGGPHATIVAEETMRKYECVDGIGLGEGETTILGILDAYSSNNFSNVNGLAYRKNNEIIVEHNEELIDDLDSLPIIDFDSTNFKIGDCISIDVGRGCPYSCIFCSTKSFWKRKFRMKSADRIFNEVSFYNAKYNVKKFDFQHDLFVANRKLVIELCRKFNDSNLNIEWTCSARIDTVDEELLKIMSEAGCKGIFFGVESGSERMQKELQKNLKMKDVKETLKHIVKYGIGGVFSFIYGFPEETEEDIELTLNLIKFIYDNYLQQVRSEFIKVQLHKLMYLPKTEITTRHKDELIHVKNYRMEVFESLDSWGDEQLTKMINDVDIFPNMFYVSNSLLENLKILDIFVFFMHSFGEIYYNTAYNYMMNEFENSILKLYFAFTKIVSEAELVKCRGKDYGESNNEFQYRYEILRKFIYNYEFANLEISMLKELFDFEHERNQLVFFNKQKNACLIKSYMYNVIDMVNSKEIDNILGKFIVMFSKKDGKRSVKYI